MKTQIIDVTDIYKPISHRKITRRKLSQIEYLMIHHSGSKKLGVAELYNLHTKDLHKWPQIGYHFYITKSKIIYKVNHLTDVVNGCKDFNTRCIHVCFEGNYNNEISPSYAGKVINEILTDLRSLNVKVTILTHRDKAKTDCCGHNLEKYIKENFVNSAPQNFLIWPELEN